MNKWKHLFVFGTPHVAIALFGLAMSLLLAVAIIHAKHGHWPYLVIWAAGVALAVFAIRPVWPRLKELL